MTNAIRKSLRTKLVGVSNYTDAVSRLQAGDTLTVQHEPDNAYDPNALQVQDAEGWVVGYLAKEVAKKVIDKDTQRVFTARVTDVTTHEGVTVGGFIEFDTEAGYFTPVQENTTKEEDMSRFAIPDEVTEQGAEGWASERSSKIRTFKLPMGQPITIVPITDYKTSNADGGWASIREVKAFGGLRVPNDPDPLELPGHLKTFPVQDFIIIKGSDGSLKRQWATDPLLERLLPSKYECKKPPNAGDDWQPPKHTRAKDITYVNCVYIDGMLEVGERAKWNPKPGDHILLAMATTWYEDWKRLMERDRKKSKDYSPAGRRWTLKITGSFAAGNLALEADDEIGEPIPLPEPVNLHDWSEAKRAEVDAWVAAYDGVKGAIFNTTDTREEEAEAVAEFEQAVETSTLMDEPPARKKKLLLAIGVNVSPTAKKDELDALVTEHELALLEYLASDAA